MHLHTCMHARTHTHTCAHLVPPSVPPSLCTHAHACACKATMAGLPGARSPAAPAMPEHPAACPCCPSRPRQAPSPWPRGKRCRIWRRATNCIAMATRHRGLISPRIQPGSRLTSEQPQSRLRAGRAGWAAEPHAPPATARPGAPPWGPGTRAPWPGTAGLGGTWRKSWLSKEAWRTRRGSGRVALSGDSAFTSFHSTHSVVSTATAGRAGAGVSTSVLLATPSAPHPGIVASCSV